MKKVYAVIVVYAASRSCKTQLFDNLEEVACYLGKKKENIKLGSSYSVPNASITIVEVGVRTRKAYINGHWVIEELPNY